MTYLIVQKDATWFSTGYSYTFYAKAVRNDGGALSVLDENGDVMAVFQKHQWHRIVPMTTSEIAQLQTRTNPA